MGKNAIKKPTLPARMDLGMCTDNSAMKIDLQARDLMYKDNIKLNFPVRQH
ncbi:hypothetical protein LFYK43_21890 [Ligilactobacillus salitolerans]|uniref:Uncharacterized protein n=1 Tax=Ligilactobacillus salitolerans TaxID=1808352 RepID=A0A401IW09_9LACO|nr:hypothetical protein [Ligilactobacillus salitolerans]GBG95730.1 hypothetical protein LFYK43_21890 [Ligilactobacillus salitolerans]